jgi:hypothetical protein
MGACLQAAFGVRTPSHASTYIAKNVELRDRLCACKDLACGQTVSRELTAWSEAFLKKLPPGTTMSAEDDQKMQSIETEVHACMQALRAGHE